MALTYGFYNSVEGDRKYDAIQMGQIFDGIITDGVYATFLKAMVVKASENASEVIVQPGRCWFNHTWTYIDADYPVEAPTPEVILDRVDALVLDINSENAFRENSLIWVQGTPSSLNPERPTLIKSVTHNQYPLCYVYRKAGTTMIYAADITNAVGTSETPFVTGVLTGINIDDLLAQWDDEFHTWEAATKTSFEAWMVNQQSVYVTWFDSIKDQMEGDLTDFEAWFETIRGIIDEEAATHLQAEIDALSEMLPAGSHIDVSTSEPTLFNRNVTVSDGVHSKTVQFDTSGAATVESFPYIGIISVTSTDGTRTAEESINIPYFGRYSTVLAFWSATVNLVGDETLAALPVTVRDGNGDVIAVVTLNASGMGVFTATKPDEYKFIYTYGGQTMEVSLAVTQETTYEVEIHGGFRFDQWLIAGRVEEEFDTLDEVLADEPTLRQLFLVHDSVDYICDSFSEQASVALADITKIFNTDLAIKWINLSDYALDHFEAVPGIKSIMDTIDKYGYGEWALMPQVPKMTSNTAPCGEVIESGHKDSNAGYMAFDNSNNTWYDTVAGSTNNYVGYSFVNPIIPKKVHITLHHSANTPIGMTRTFLIQGSNDGTTWTTLETFSCEVTVTPFATKEFNLTLDTNIEYSMLRLFCEETLRYSNIWAFYIASLQFYAWGLKGLVPVMTANDLPYGAASANSEFGTASRTAYSAFSNDYGNEQYVSWTTKNDISPNWLQYRFINPTIVKKAVVRVYKTGMSGPISVVIQGSHDGITYTNVSDSVTISNNDGTDIVEIDVDTNGLSCLDYRLFTSSVICTATGGKFFGFQLQFYGRELKGLVPNMSSDTFPFGIVMASGEYGTQYAKWKAFDRVLTNSSDCWVSPNGTISGNWLGYSFGQSVSVNSILLRNRGSVSGAETVSPVKNFKIQGSNNGNTWNDIQSYVNPVSNTGDFADYSITNESEAYSYYRLYVIDGYATNYVAIANLQFYGPDYSEKEFEIGTTKKWLYDHGLDLVGFDKYKGSTTASSIFMDDRNELYFQSLDGTNANYSNYSLVGKTVDLSEYSVIMMNVGSREKFTYISSTGYSGSIIAWKTSGIPVSGTFSDSNMDVAKHISIPPVQLTGKDYMANISAINESKWTSIGVLYQNGREIGITEFWLE